MIILVLLIAGFILWHFIPGSGPDKPNPRFRGDNRVSMGNPNWRTAIEAHCESPAETAFLSAMIDSHKLVPRDGSLIGKDIKLDLQVGEGSYRVDFLVNDWLVVEVDGAAYHSSSDQKKRDAARDGYFTGLGYAVIRIPAKTVFQRPNEALLKVAAGLTAGKPELRQLTKTTGRERLAKTANGFFEGLAQVNRYVESEREVKKAVGQAQEIVNQERQAIDIALDRAARQLIIDDYCDTDEKREKFERKKAEIKIKIAAANQVPYEPFQLAISNIMQPAIHENLELNEIIQRRYNYIIYEREKMFIETSVKLKNDPKLRPLVISALEDIGCGFIALKL